MKNFGDGLGHFWTWRFVRVELSLMTSRWGLLHIIEFKTLSRPIETNELSGWRCYEVLWQIPIIFFKLLQSFLVGRFSTKRSVVQTRTVSRNFGHQWGLMIIRPPSSLFYTFLTVIFPRQCVIIFVHWTNLSHFIDWKIRPFFDEYNLMSASVYYFFISF